MLTHEFERISTYAPNPVWALIIQHMYVETKKGRAAVPMAALCKRLDLRMSTLQRHLTSISDHDLIDVHCDAAGRWTTWLTTEGLDFCSAAEAQAS